MKKKTKTILGHSHTPAIAKGAYAVGTSVRYHQQYNKGFLRISKQGSGWIIGGDLIEGYVVSHHEEPENRRREAVMATRAKYGR